MRSWRPDERNSKIEIQNALWIVMNVVAKPEANLEVMIEAWQQKDGGLS